MFISKTEFDRALPDLDRAIELGPPILLAHFSRAKAYEALGNKAKAMDDYKKVMEMKTATPIDVLTKVEAKKRIEALGDTHGGCQRTRDASCL